MKNLDERKQDLLNLGLSDNYEILEILNNKKIKIKCKFCDSEKVIGSCNFMAKRFQCDTENCNNNRKQEKPRNMDRAKKLVDLEKYEILEIFRAKLGKEKYKNTYIKIKCKTCGDIRDINFPSKKYNIKCHNCNIIIAKENLKKLNIKYTNFEYFNKDRKMYISYICKDCNSKNIVNIQGLLKLIHRCTVCNPISSMENIIKKYLTSHDIKFCHQHRFDECKNVVPLPFDFFLPEFNILIEADGAGHFRPVQFGGMSNVKAEEAFNKIKINDEIKNKFAKDNNIKLLRISYLEAKNIYQILDKELFI
jgi:ribosomal protein S27E